MLTRLPSKVHELWKREKAKLEVQIKATHDERAKIREVWTAEKSKLNQLRQAMEAKVRATSLSHVE
jgi:predicted  nucleic acid-binding Zn-ribbon protein